ncbi:MAG: hypothetical protein JXQ96_13860 [Cyclobacteriaceae bacterium]
MTLSIFLYGLFNVLLLGGLSHYFFINLQNPIVGKFFYPALVWKVVCGLCIGLLYKYHYGSGDTFYFFEQAKILAERPILEQIKEVFLTSIPHSQRSTLPMIKITSLVTVVTGSNYWLCSLYFSLASFFGAVFFVNNVNRRWPQLTLPAAMAFLFFPSIAFWSSGVLKESLAFGIITFLSGIYLKFDSGKLINSKMIVLAVITAWLLILLKYYIAAVFLPLVGILLAVGYLEKNNSIYNSSKKVKFWILSGIILIGVLWGFSMQYNLNPLRLFFVVTENQASLLASSSGSSIVYFDESRSKWFYIPNLFIALFSGLFRPIFPEELTFPGVISGLENVLVLSLASYAIWIKKWHNWSFSKDFMAVMVYVFLLSAILSYASPNFGTLARYKVYYMPFFVFLTSSTLPFMKTNYLNWPGTSKYS